MILPRKQPPAEWPEDWDEETKQAADMYEAIPSDTNWLDGIEDKGLLPVLPEPLPDYDAPLVASFWIEHLTEEQQFRDAALRAEVEGPDASVWRYLESIDSEIARLTQACRASTGLERESNLRQLRESEQGRSAFTRSHEFCEALRNLIAVTDSKNAHCANPTPEQQAAARRWGEIRTEWMRFKESMLVESRRSALDGSDDDTAPVAGTNVERGHCQPEPWIVRARKYADDLWHSSLDRNKRPSKEDIAKTIAGRLHRDDKMVTKRHKRISPDYVVRFALNPKANGGWSPPDRD